MLAKCPGQDRRYWKPEDIFEEPCKECGALIEFWKTDFKVRCPNCGAEQANPRFNLGCAAWCEYAEQCIGGISGFASQRPENIRDRLEAGMRRALIRHKDLKTFTLKVTEIAEELIKEEKNAVPVVVMGAALLHKVDSADKSTDTADEILKRVKLEANRVEEIKQMIEHLQSNDLDTINFNILKDACLIAGVADGQKNADEVWPMLRLESARRYLKKNYPLS